MSRSRRSFLSLSAQLAAGIAAGAAVLGRPAAMAQTGGARRARKIVIDRSPLWRSRVTIVSVRSSNRNEAGLML